MFPDIDYLDWIEGRPEAATHDLASSNLRPTPGGAVVPSALEGFDDPTDVTVESLVADRYDVDPDQVLVTPGASAANFIAVATALGDDGTTLVERPGYEPMWATPRALGANVDRFRRTREDVWMLDPDRVAAAVVDDTALVSVTNRHNPTGVATSRDELRAVAERVHDRGARLLVDEVYAPYGVDAASDVPCAVGLDGCIVTGSLTKYLGLGGLHIGWLIADAPFVERARQAERHLSAVAEPSRALARRALSNDTELAGRSRRLAASNHDLLRQFVAARPALSGVVADGCPYALLFHEALDGDAVHDLAVEWDVLVVPGRFFEVPEAFRLALGRDPESMAAALDAFGAALDERAESG